MCFYQLSWLKSNILFPKLIKKFINNMLNYKNKAKI